MTRVGVYPAVIGTALGVTTVILDGVGAKQLADEWVAASADKQAVALRIGPDGRYRGLSNVSETVIRVCRRP